MLEEKTSPVTSVRTWSPKREAINPEFISSPAAGEDQVTVT